jgi:O-antigen biosynthesis protein
MRQIKLLRPHYKPILVPSTETDATERGGGKGSLPTPHGPHFLLKGPLPSGYVRVRYRASAPGLLDLKLLVGVPGGHSSENTFAIGLVGPEEKLFSTFVLLNKRASQVRIVSDKDPAKLVLKELVLIPVFKVEIVFTAIFRFIRHQKGAARVLFGMLARLLYLMDTIDVAKLNVSLNRIVIGQQMLLDKYDYWIKRNTPDESQLDSLRAQSAALSYKPVFSMVVRVASSDASSLRKCIQSIIDQVYAHWELWIVSSRFPEQSLEWIPEEFKAIATRIKVFSGKAPGDEPAVAGDFICPVHGDATLAPEALAEFALHLNNFPDTDMLYSDEDRIDSEDKRVEVFFKPDWSPEYLESFAYVSSLACYRTTIIRKTGPLSVQDELTIDFDMALRFSELTQKIVHIPKVLYHRPLQDSNNDEVDYQRNAVQFLENRLHRLGIKGRVTGRSPFPDLFDMRYDIVNNPLVSIIIPAGGRKASIHGVTRDLLSGCVASIRDKSTYKNYEIIVVHDSNLDSETTAFLKTNECKLITFEGEFNFSAKINLGTRNAEGEHFLFLNDDTEVISPDWLSRMLQFSQRKGVGVVGARLYFEDGTIQHVGVTLNRDNFPVHIYYGYPASLPGYFYSIAASRNCLAVTGACLMTQRHIFEELGGFDEAMPLNYNDVDYCLKAYRSGYRVVVAPLAELWHFESKSRTRSVMPDEMEYFASVWHSKLKNDPYYNINLEASPPIFEIRTDL